MILRDKEINYQNKPSMCIIDFPVQYKVTVDVGLDVTVGLYIPTFPTEGDVADI